MQVGASCLSVLYNFGTPVPCVPAGIDIPGLDGVLDQLENSPFLPGITFTRINVFTRMHAFVENPAAFGLTNVTDHCVLPDEPPYACKVPDGYLFWDGAHPSKTVHAIIAGLVAAELAQLADTPAPRPVAVYPASTAARARVGTRVS